MDLSVSANVQETPKLPKNDRAMASLVRGIIGIYIEQSICLLWRIPPSKLTIMYLFPRTEGQHGVVVRALVYMQSECLFLKINSSLRCCFPLENEVLT